MRDPLALQQAPSQYTVSEAIDFIGMLKFTQQSIVYEQCWSSSANAKFTLNTTWESFNCAILLVTDSSSTADSA